MSYSGSGWKKGGVLEAFYGGYQALGGYTGGAVGGASDLSERTGTGFHSAAKRALIKDFQQILLKLGMDEFKGVDDIDEVLRLMRKRVPDPRKGKGNGLSWGKDKQGQVAVCKTLAAAINDRAPGLINIKVSPDDLCRQISEVVYDLFGGLSAELLTSRTNLEKAVKNLRSLKKFLDDNFKLIESKISADKDSTLGSETSAARGLHHDLLEEVDRHLAKLQMMIDTVVQPSELELAKLERDNEEFSTLVKKIDKDFGTREAGRKISYTLTGFVTAVEAARIVDKALQKLGLSIKEYSDAKEFKDLKTLLSEKDLEALAKSEVDLEAYESAKRDLLKLHYLHEDVAEALKGKRGGLFNPIANGGQNGGLFNPIDGGTDGLFNPIAFGGEDGGSVTGGLKLDKRVKRRQDLKRALIKDFNDRLAQLINIVLGASKHVAVALGDGKTEMSDAVYKFVKALESLPSLQDQYTYFCLTGAVDDIRAREEREKFISRCKYVVSTIDELLKENKSGHLKDMRDAFNNIISLIESYVAKFAEGFGPLESWESYSKKIKGAEDGAAEGGVGVLDRIKDAVWGKKSDDPEKMAAREENKKATMAIKNKLTGVALSTLNKGAEVIGDAVSKGIQQGLAKSSASASGMGEGFEAFVGGASGASYARIASSFDDAVNTITYFHRIAVMRRGLDKASKEFKSYKDDYVKILADAVARGRDDNAKSKKAFLDEFEIPSDGIPDPARAVPTLFDQFCSTAAGALTGEALVKAKASFEKAKQFAASLFNSVDNMYKVAESMDIYMKEFTDAISANPDDVQNIMKILDDTEIISKWFDEKSGDFVCRVFDSFPGYYERTGAGANEARYTNLNHKKNKLNDAHYYLRVATLLNLGRLPELQAQGHTKTTGLDLAAAAAAGSVRAYIAANPRLGVNPDVFTGTLLNLPGNPYLSTPAQFKNSDDNNEYHSGVAAFEAAQKALKQVSSLKNLVAAFVTIGERFGGKDLISKTNMSPKLLLQYLSDYIAASAFKLGFSHDAAGNATVNRVLNGSSYKIDEPIDNQHGTTHTGILTLGYNSNDNDVAGARTKEILYLTTLMRGRQIDTLMGDNDMFKQSDKLFQLVIKSMTAKILTVIGTFNMFNRPINRNGLGYYSDLRLILGGAEYPGIIPEAFELYIRLPLLAEAYRKIFGFDNLTGAGTAISMIPEVDGTFTDLISLIFDRARSVQDGNYSDTETRVMIEAINKIYGRFKNSKNPIRDCIEEFVADINRRYGVVTAEERAKYIKDRNSRYDTKYEDASRDVDYELNAIDEDDTFVRPSPSDQYRIFESGKVDIKHKHELKIDSDEKMLRELRKKIDDLMGACKKRAADTTDLQGLRTLSFQTMINARSHELTHATSDKHRYEIVRNAIASLGTFAVSSLERTYLLFHETVVAGISALRLLYKNLNKFEDSVYNIWHDYNRVSQRINELRNNDGQNGRPPKWKGYRAAIPAPALKKYGFAANGLAANTQGSRYAGAVANANGLMQLYQVNGAGFAAGIGNRHTHATLRALDKDDLIAEALLRFSLNQDEMFADLLEAVYNHGSTLSDLVEIKIDVSRNDDKPGNPYKYGERKMAIHVDYSKLRERVYSLFNSIKASMDKFRGLLPQAVLDRYEKFNPEAVDTIYSLEKSLIDGLIEGRYSTDDDTVASGQRLTHTRTMDGCNKKIKQLLDYFTYPWRVSGHAVTGNGWDNNEWDPATAALRAFDKFTLHQFNQPFYDAIYRPVNTANSMQFIANSIATAPATGILRLLYNTDSKKKLTVEPGNPWTNINAYINILSTNNGQWNELQRDLVSSFNKLISVYLTQIYDEPSRTVYLPALNKFVAGSFSAAIMGDKYYNDATYNETLDLTGVLFRSLAVAIKQLATEKNVVGSELEFGKSDLAQIPTYVKERLRANLPVLQKLFTMLMRRAEIIRKCTAALYVAQPVAVAAVVAGAGAAVATNAQLEPKLMRIIDQVSYGCQSIVQCCQDVLTDLADSPKYMELHSEFIQEYENMNGVSPYMPLSSALQLVQYEPTKIWKVGMPINSIGSNEAKILYGTRGLLNGKTTLADIPTMARLLKDHNNTVDPRHHLTEKDLQAFADNYVEVAKYLVNSKLYSQQLSLKNNTATAALGAGTLNAYTNAIAALANGNQAVTAARVALAVGVNAARVAALQNAEAALPALIAQVETTMTAHLNAMTPQACRFDLLDDPYNNDTKNWVFQLHNQDRLIDLAQTLRLTESNFQREERSRVVKHVEQGDSSTAMISGTRDELIGCNIIDLNIVPINIHALMREIPMVNLYNYAYTFDRMIEEVLEQKGIGLKLPDDDDQLITLDGRTNAVGPTYQVDKPDELLAVLMMRPYKAIDERAYEALVSRIMRGAIGIEGLGRPKYLGDELYNKALFGEIYSNESSATLESDAGLAGARNSGAIARNLRILGKELALGFGAGLNEALLPALSLYLMDNIYQRMYNTGAGNVPGAPGNVAVDVARAARLAAVTAAAAGDAPSVAAIQTVIDAALAVPYGARWAAAVPAAVNAAVAALPAARGAANIAAMIVACVLVHPPVKVITGTSRNDRRAAIQRAVFGAASNANLLNALLAANANGALPANTRPLEDKILDFYENNINNFARSSRLGPDSLEESANLHFIAKDDVTRKAKVVPVDVNTAKDVLKSWGKQRFDTRFVRNLFWIANIQRLLRLKLRRDLTWYNSKVVSSHATVASGITELYDHDVAQPIDMYNYKY